jgi:AcrR family transcriptional regulator
MTTSPQARRSTGAVASVGGGYHGMSLEDVAERTDIVKATLYHYVSGKDGLVGEALEALTVPCSNGSSPRATPKDRRRAASARHD